MTRLIVGQNDLETWCKQNNREDFSLKERVHTIHQRTFRWLCFEV